MSAGEIIRALASICAEYPALVAAAGLVAWLLFVVTTVAWFHIYLPHADRDSNREQTDREPVAERPSVIFASSNHGDLSA